MKTYSFENLDVWKKSRELVAFVYRIQSTFPSYERYGLGGPNEESCRFCFV